ncbi:hypothetical protein PVT01_030006700 [Plasmodium vivax]|uniref:Uncharacterized protein n=2 Tax=Plasmodium vivax TaxID=5855 RepID=A0A1G4GRQ3_PLAVI|nr:hypothetical protein PVBG_02951 [Plasmodium vivax Brazil I]SCO65257.1 hypothetical protein PVT01_030006700 [Plasmodium vivax]
MIFKNNSVMYSSKCYVEISKWCRNKLPCFKNYSWMILLLLHVLLLNVVPIWQKSARSKSALCTTPLRQLTESLPQLSNFNANGNDLYDDDNNNLWGYSLHRKLPYGCNHAELFQEMSEKEVENRINSFGIFVSKKNMYITFITTIVIKEIIIIK